MSGAGLSLPVRGLVLAVLVVTGAVVVLSGTAAAGGPTGEGNGVDATEASLQISAIDAPDEIAIDQPLKVTYTVENTGNESGTEGFVDLVVGGDIRDTDEDVTVGAGKTVSATLVFDRVYIESDPGGTLEFAVELFDYGDIASGQTAVSGDNPPPVPDIELVSVEAPDSISETDNLVVGYTLANTGGVDGQETFVDLLVDGLGVWDWDENVTVPAGETVSGTLVFDDVSGTFELGETVGFEVALADFGDSTAGETTVGLTGDLQLTEVSYPENTSVGESLEVTYTVENVGDAAATESAVSLLVGKSYDDATEADRHENVTVPAGKSTSRTLVFDAVAAQFDAGETLGFGVVLQDFEDQTVHQVEVQGESQSGPDLQLSSVDAPATVQPEGTLEVDYTVENVGDTQGTESAVRLLVNGQQVDQTGNVTVGAGGQTSGTLGYGQFDNGDTLNYTVELADFGDSTGGQAVVQSQDSELALVAVDAPAEIGTDERLELTYTVENSGTQTGAVEGVRLLVDGQEVDTEDSLAVDPGDSKSRTLVDENAGDRFGDSETLSYTVELTGIGDSTGGEVSLDTQTEADLQLSSVDAPDEVGIEDVLPVSYTVENVGEGEGVESAVNLLVDGTVVDTDQNVTVSAGGTESGALVFDSIDQEFSTGETIVFTVELSTFADSLGATTDIGGDSNGGGDNGTDGDDSVSAGADLQVTALDAPDVVGVDEDLTVTYTITNVGNESGTESFVDFRVDGGIIDVRESVTVDPDESLTGSFSYDSVRYDLGDTVQYTVELADFGDSRGGQASVGTLDQSGSLAIQSAVQTDSVSVSVNVTALDVQDEFGYLAAENLDNDASARVTPVQEGDFETVSLDSIGGVAVGDTIEVRLAAESEFTTVLDTDTTTVEAGENVPIASFGWNPPVPDVGQPVAFDAGNSRGEGGAVVEYRWDFDADGEFEVVDDSPTAEYTFDSAGVAEVTLIVENEVGLTTERVSQVTVQQGLAPAESSLSGLDIAGQGSEATVQEGAADVSVAVDNVGEEDGIFTLSLSIGDRVTETARGLDVAGGASQQVSFDDVTAVLDPGTYDVTVTAPNDTVSGTVSVETDTDPTPQPEFAVSIVETSSPVGAGESLTVTAKVENTGDADGTATLTLDGGVLGEDTASVGLDSGDSDNTTVTLAGVDDTGEYDVTVSVGDSESSATVSVEDSGDGSSATPVIAFLVILVLLLLVGGLYYYVYEEESSEQMEPL